MDIADDALLNQLEQTGRGTGLPIALGVASVALGAGALAAPGLLARRAGVDGIAHSREIIRAVGARELVSAAGLLSGRAPAGWSASRVAGDAVDLALIGAALTRLRGERRRRAAQTGAMLAGIAALDLIATLRAARTRRARERMILTETAVTVNRPPAEAYRFWRDLENLPSFMAHLESVRVDDGNRSHWVARGPAGRSVEWDAEIVDDRPEELITWRSLPGTRVPNCGRVRLRPAPGDRGTEVRVELAYAPPAGSLGRRVAKLFGEEPEQQIRDDLRRFKQVLEAGEVVRSDASPDGITFAQQVKQRPAQPLPTGSHG